MGIRIHDGHRMETGTWDNNGLVWPGDGERVVEGGQLTRRGSWIMGSRLGLVVSMEHDIQADVW